MWRTHGLEENPRVGLGGTDQAHDHPVSQEGVLVVVFSGQGKKRFDGLGILQFTNREGGVEANARRGVTKRLDQACEGRGVGCFTQYLCSLCPDLYILVGE